MWRAKDHGQGEGGMGSFAGKVALVTGTSGIGRAAARRLAADGATVLALGIDPQLNAGFDSLA